MRVCDTAEPPRLLTSDDLYVFANVSNNHNPMHLTQGDADHDGRPDAWAQRRKSPRSRVSAVRPNPANPL
jgi:hypothetical protein